MSDVRKWIWGAAVALVVTAAACTPDQPSTTETPSSRDESVPVAEPKDRDPAAVMAAVRRIDFCAVARQVTGAADVSARDPFSCEGSGASVGVVQLGADKRLTFPARVIDGAKAYVDSSRPDDCVVYFPLSFKFALQVDGAGCEPAVDVTLAATPRWDACGALAQTADEGDLTEAGATIGTACERTEPDLARLEFGTPLVGPTRTETVGGVQVEVQEDDTTGRTVCWAAWPGTDGLWTAVAAASCAQARTLAESVMTVLGSPPPDVAPQNPLLYGPDEPDTPSLGACANLDRKVAIHCRPYTDTGVPDDEAALLDAGADTQCAVARDAVTRHLGTHVVPVAVDDGELASCYFVESERQVQVRFQVESDPIDGVPEVFSVREAEIAGHPGYVEEGQAYRVWVATSDDPNRDGGLSLTIEAGPAKRDGQPPAEVAAMAESIIADLLATHFS